MKPILAVLVVMVLCVCVLPSWGAVDAGVAPVAVYTFGIGDKSPEAMAGVSLGLHVIPESATNKTQDWLAKHTTLELPVIGETFSTLRMNIGAAVNLDSKEGVGLKAGLAYLWEQKDAAVIVGINFPL